MNFDFVSFLKLQTYGLSFILGPALVLLLAGYLANRRTWRLITGTKLTIENLIKKV